MVFIKRWRLYLIWILGIILVLGVILYLLKWANFYPTQENLENHSGFFGVTFSTEFCDELGLDWKETYQAIINDLQVKYIRIPVYWDELETTKDSFDFSKYDYLLNAGEKQGVKFIIVVGRRVPRWPECHTPDWVNQESASAAQADTLQEIKTIVERYRNRASVEYWQVENEPFLGSFGVCPPLDVNFLKQEFALVRSLDSRKIIITGSGELRFWNQEAQIGDIFGTTLYRVVYSDWFGYLKYPFPVAYYRFKAWFAGLSQERTIVAELQAEPWVPSGPMTALTPSQIDKTLSVERFKANLQYAIDLNFNQTYIWGVEWWYWQKKYGNPQYWQIAETIF